MVESRISPLTYDLLSSTLEVRYPMAMKPVGKRLSAVKKAPVRKPFKAKQEDELRDALDDLRDARRNINSARRLIREALEEL